MPENTKHSVVVLNELRLLPGLKDLPASVLPSGWRAAQLKDCCNILQGGRLGLTKEKHYRSSGTAAYSASGQDGFVEQVECNRDGVVLSSIGANCGKCFFASGAWTTLANTQAILPKQYVLDAKFAYYRMNLPNYWPRSGSAQPFIKPSDIGKCWLAFPESLSEQSQISTILSTLDEAIGTAEALIAKLLRIKHGLMQDLLTRGIDDNGNIRTEKTHKFKDSPLGRIPEAWEIRPLREYLQYISYGFTNPMPETEDGPYMVTAANIFGGRLQYETCRHTSEYAFRNLLTKKSKPVLNDILLTKDGSLGRLALVDRSDICINQSVAVLRTGKSASPQFIKRLLEASGYQKKMDDDAGGSTIRHIYITRVDKMPIAVPRSGEEQTRICSMLSQADCWLEVEIAHQHKLCSLKRGLMEDLLTGRVRVNHLLRP